MSNDPSCHPIRRQPYHVWLPMVPGCGHKVCSSNSTNAWLFMLFVYSPLILFRWCCFLLGFGYECENESLFTLRRCQSTCLFISFAAPRHFLSFLLQKGRFSPYDNVRLHHHQQHQYSPTSVDNSVVTYRSFKDGVGSSTVTHECIRAELV